MNHNIAFLRVGPSWRQMVRCFVRSIFSYCFLSNVLWAISGGLSLCSDVLYLPQTQSNELDHEELIAWTKTSSHFFSFIVTRVWPVCLASHCSVQSWVGLCARVLQIGICFLHSLHPSNIDLFVLTLTFHTQREVSACRGGRWWVKVPDKEGCLLK